MKKKTRKKLAGIVAAATLMFGLATGTRAEVPQEPKGSVKIELSSEKRDPFVAEALDARSNLFGLKYGNFSLQAEENQDVQDGEDFLAASYKFKRGSWDVNLGTRLSTNQPDGDKPVREVSAIAKRRKLGLIGVKSLNTDFTKVGGWYKGAPVGSLHLDASAGAKILSNGSFDYDLGLGLRSDKFGAWAGYNTDNTGEVFFVGNSGRFGGSGLLFNDSDGGKYGSFRFAHQRDGKLGGQFEVDSGLSLIRSFQVVPPFIGNDGGLLTDGDLAAEAAFVDNDMYSFGQVLVGGQVAEWNSGRFGVAGGPRYHFDTRNLDPAYELRLEQEVFGKDTYVSVRGPDPMVKVGMSVSF